MTGEKKKPWVIVGGGLAAGKAAATLRKEGFDGQLVVVTEEPHQPYARPNLSKEYLRGESGVEKLWAADADLWARSDTELRTGRRAASLDLQGHRLELDDGSVLPYERLLIATGASAVRGGIRGSDLDFVHVLRTIEDADRLRAAAGASSIVVAGGGWIGAETAASLRQMGNDVTLAIPGQEVLERRLGSEVGRLYSSLHERHGVRLVRGARVAEVVNDSAGRGLRLADGTHVRADLVVLGFGAVPNVELASGAGLVVSGGIVVNPQLETEAQGVFAAGDVASAWHPRYGRAIRTEHWDTARRQGTTAALNLLGRGVAYDRLPYFYSDQFELGMEAYGLPDAGQQVVVRSYNDGDKFVALWLVDGRVEAGLHGNDWDAGKIIERLVSDRVALDVLRFRDASVPLAELVPAHAESTSK
jgi:3-phenylpropionate/trans-cinnamate dioxygenase ferredoxin reductase subunit